MKNEAIYPVKGSELLLVIILKIRVEIHNYFLNIKRVQKK